MILPDLNIEPIATTLSEAPSLEGTHIGDGDSGGMEAELNALLKGSAERYESLLQRKATALLESESSRVLW